MRWLNGFVAFLAVGSLVAACSSGSAPEPRPAEEKVGSVTSAITTACNTDTLGLPCDPDGPGGPKLECEGACTIAQSGLVACISVVTGALDGVICGTTAGVGDAACKRYCSGKTCLAVNAPSGAACRPTSKSNPCEGQCDGAGTCNPLGGQACSFGRDGQLCTFATCDFANATQCVTKNVLRNTLCSDTDACSIGRCSSAGVCVAGPTVGCDDGNACTDDSCDPNDGGCVGVNDDSNACSDGNACLTGEHCSKGSCVPGTIDVDCDDNNACTTDSCDPNTGCAHVPTNACNDGNACTQDTCAPADGSCSHDDVVCNDNDDCTDDSCAAPTGCVFAPKNCDDNDMCTADSCSAGSCQHPTVSCNDNDPCTADSCAAAVGCEHAPIADCGTAGAGAGGDGAGGVPTDVAGAPGLPEGGSSVTEGGTPSAGTTGQGGTAGQAGTPAGGTTNTAGTPATAGSQTGGGTAGATGGSSTGGTSGGEEGGEPAGGSSAGGRASESGGCGCKTAGGPSRRSGSSLVLLALAGVGWLRRRRVA